MTTNLPETIRTHPADDSWKQWVMVERHGEFYVIEKRLADEGYWGNVRQILKHDKETCEAIFADFIKRLDEYKASQRKMAAYEGRVESSLQIDIGSCYIDGEARWEIEEYDQETVKRVIAAIEAIVGPPKTIDY